MISTTEVVTYATFAATAVNAFSSHLKGWRRDKKARSEWSGVDTKLDEGFARIDRRLDKIEVEAQEQRSRLTDVAHVVWGVDQKNGLRQKLGEVEKREQARVDRERMALERKVEAAMISSAE